MVGAVMTEIATAAISFFMYATDPMRLIIATAIALVLIIAGRFAIATPVFDGAFTGWIGRGLVRFSKALFWTVIAAMFLHQVGVKAGF
jgi:hypothetical protein